MIIEVKAKSVLTYHERSFPTHWDVNPYRGCTIGCKYCFAQYTHQYLGSENFFKDIYVKTNVAEILDKELSKKTWQGHQIKIGGTTDIYQHSELSYALLPKIYEVIIKHKNPVFIQTKSSLILRDIDIIKEIAKVTQVDIATSINTLDENTRKIIEPGASKTLDRINMLSQFVGIAKHTILGLMPIIPYITDETENLDQIFSLSKENNFSSLVNNLLFLKGDYKIKFFNLIRDSFPERFEEFARLYENKIAFNNFSILHHEKIQKLKTKYNQSNLYTAPSHIKKVEQLTLF